MMVHPEILVRTMLERRLDIARDIERARGSLPRTGRGTDAPASAPVRPAGGSL